ncbi:hypothetical protein VCV18_001589 [Metarhizium anisopliae]
MALGDAIERTGAFGSPVSVRSVNGGPNIEYGTGSTDMEQTSSIDWPSWSTGARGDAGRRLAPSASH